MASKLKSSANVYNGGIQSVLLTISTAPLTKSQKKWRVAYIVTYVSLSFVKRFVSRKGKPSPRYLNALESPHTVLESNPVAAVLHKVEDGRGLNTELDQKKLTQMAKNKNLEELHGFGGVETIVKLLETDMENGINGDDVDLTKRRLAFGSNTYEKPKPKGLIHFVIEAFKDITIIILLACAAMSLAFGIREHGAREGWYKWGIIFVAVFLLVAVSAASNFCQDKQFDKLSKISNNIKIDVVREGRRQKVSIFDLVVGDVVFLNIGDQVPADGLFIDGHSFQVDESRMTGEREKVVVNSLHNPFLLSGSKVADGYSRMLVISVGMNTAWGEMMSSITRDSNEQTPLQERLNNMTSSIGKNGIAVAFFFNVVMLIHHIRGNTEDKNRVQEFNGSNQNINFVFQSVLRIVSAAFPEGLTLAVTLTLAYSMKRMMADQAMVRKLSACETMGSATIICTDKTGTLTSNQKKVTKFCVGHEEIGQDFSHAIARDFLELFYQGVAFNTTGSIYKPKSGSSVEYSGSPTEKAILSWAVQDLDMDMEKLKHEYTVLHVETFTSEKKRSGVLIRNNGDNYNYVHWKGAAELVLKMCSNYHEHTGEIKSMSQEKRSQFENIIQGTAASSLQCIAFAYKQMKPEECISTEDDKTTATSKNLREQDLTLLGIVGMKDPCRSGPRKAIQSCRAAGVDIKMITGDNIFTAKAIATECGILDPNQQVATGEVIEGTDFRNYTHEERMRKITNIRVMARSSPLDKRQMVQCLKEKGQMVAVLTGDGTNDAPSLKEAHVGLSMGIQGTEVAKESSDIVILNDNFSSVAAVLRWGRCIYNNIQKFIQFQLTVRVAALVINSIAAVSAGDIPLTAAQLLWVNLIIETLGALALATEWPSEELMDKPPIGRTEPLITNIMWRNLLPQALYQIGTLLILQFRGMSIFKVNEQVNNTVIFNTFVLCQVFNMFNSRNMEKKNVFKGIHQNMLFLGIIAITIILQIVMVEFLRNFADTVSLSLEQWGICVAIAALTWPIGWIMKFVPVTEKPFLSYFADKFILG